MAKLTAKQQMFVKEYLIDLNATQAAIRAGYSERTAEVIGHENLRKPNIANAIQQVMDERSEKTEITAEMVMLRWWELATADPNDIVQLRRLCCRHCFGVDHQYQWTDRSEYERAVKSAIEIAKTEDREPMIPSDDGGYGFESHLRPRPKCPNCKGEGRIDLHMADTRYLQGGAKYLYAGIKQTQSGIEIRMHDQMKALENVARHLGMFTDKVEHSGGQTLTVVFDEGMTDD